MENKDKQREWEGVGFVERKEVFIHERENSRYKWRKRERERRKCEKAKGLPITSAVSEIYSRSLLK